jgi:hypothetical protein
VTVEFCQRGRTPPTVIHRRYKQSGESARSTLTARKKETERS